MTDANLAARPARRASRAGSSSTARRPRTAVTALGEQLGLGERETAEGIVRVANAEMVRALRVMTVERGVDPRELALMAFGGAGGLHAAAIAEELGMTRILCPRASGVLAALGLVVSERRRDVQRSVLLKAGRARRRGGRAGAAGARRAPRGRRRAHHRRAALPRPGVRARRAAQRQPRGGLPRGPRGGLRLPRSRGRGRARDAARDGHHAGAGDRPRRGRRGRRGRASSTRRDTLVRRHRDHPRRAGAGRADRGPGDRRAARRRRSPCRPGWSGEVLESGTIRVER